MSAYYRSKMEQSGLKLKFLGCLIGAALGDSLGTSFEGRKSHGREEIYAQVGKRKMLKYTDDTHMTIGVAESLIACHGFDGSNLAQTFTRNFEQEPWRGYGPGPPQIFRLIKLGNSWHKASELIYPGGSFGNGAAMRISPVGLFYFDNLEKLREVAYLSSQITHAHPLGKEGAALQACAVALAIRSNPASALDRESFSDSLKKFARQEIYRQKMEKAKELLRGADKGEVIQELGHGIKALSSVPTAIYSFLRHPDSFEKAVVYAISLGGDADTIGSMTGAISGACLGHNSIPENWGAKLENSSYIEELAVKLWEVRKWN